MDLLDLLPAEHVLVPLVAPDLRDAVEQLARRLDAAGAVRSIDGVLERLRSEPFRDVIALSEDVVLPHFRTDAVDALVLALGIAPEPIPSRDPAVDARPRIVALILAPTQATALYLQVTSTLARLLHQPEVVAGLASQTSTEGVLALPQLRDLAVRPRLAVRDVMTHRIHSLPPDATLGEAMSLMMRRRLRAVPVVGPKGEVLGMLTDSDLLRVFLPQIPRVSSDDPIGSHVLDRQVRDIMTRSVLCVSDELGLSEVANMMMHKDVEQVPVVQAGTISGMISRADILRKLFSRR